MTMEQLLKDVEEKSKAHALSVRVHRAALDVASHATEAASAACWAKVRAYDRFNDAVIAVQNYHSGETK